MKISHQEIDNAYTPLQGGETLETFAKYKMYGRKLIDEDPGTTKRHMPKPPGAGPTHNLDAGEGISIDKLRFVCGQDDKMEQKIAYESSCAFYAKYTLYDIEMRKFIKEKFGVEIQSLLKKWSRLCWNCFTEKEGLKKCSMCKIARYCNKDCQAKDWKIHKELHTFENWVEPYKQNF